MATLRFTTRIGPCILCGQATMMACIGCERFVCVDCEANHRETRDR